MRLFAPDTASGLRLAERVHPKYAPAFAEMPPDARAATALYFLPHNSAKAVLGVTRPRVIKWYCPFADQSNFPSGRRYCINVYAGCSHGCVYCYAAGYQSLRSRSKADFRRLLRRDLEDIELFDLPATPVHLSNSTDAFQQPLESQRGDALYTLRKLLERRRRFTTITLLTKNPGLLTQPGYLDTLQRLHCPDRAVVVEVSLALWREQVAHALDPGAPPPSARLAAMRKLRAAGMPVVLRLSPVFPLDRPLADGLVVQSTDDVKRLVGAAVDAGIREIVYTPAKIVRPQQAPLHPRMQQMLDLYRQLNGPDRLDFRGGSWRLGPAAVRRTIAEPLQNLCQQHGLALTPCRTHLLRTR